MLDSVTTGPPAGVTVPTILMSDHSSDDYHRYVWDDEMLWQASASPGAIRLTESGLKLHERKTFQDLCAKKAPLLSVTPQRQPPPQTRQPQQTSRRIRHRDGPSQAHCQQQHADETNDLRQHAASPKPARVSGPPNSERLGAAIKRRLTGHRKKQSLTDLSMVPLDPDHWWDSIVLTAANSRCGDHGNHHGNTTTTPSPATSPRQTTPSRPHQVSPPTTRQRRKSSSPVPHRFLWNRIRLASSPNCSTPPQEYPPLRQRALSQGDKPRGNSTTTTTDRNVPLSMGKNIAPKNWGKDTATTTNHNDDIPNLPHNKKEMLRKHFLKKLQERDRIERFCQDKPVRAAPVDLDDDLDSQDDDDDDEKDSFNPNKDVFVGNYDNNQHPSRNQRHYYAKKIHKPVMDDDDDEDDDKTIPTTNRQSSF